MELGFDSAALTVCEYVKSIEYREFAMPSTLNYTMAIVSLYNYSAISTPKYVSGDANRFYMASDKLRFGSTLAYTKYS